MTSRERVRASLARQPIDRVPRLLYEEVIGYTPPIEALLAQHCAPRAPRDHFAMDLTSVCARPTTLPRSRFAPWLGPDADNAIAAGQVDEWGVRWKTGALHHFAEIDPPLRGPLDESRLAEFPLPDLEQPYRWDGLDGQIAALHAQGFAVAAYAGSIFEQSWFLRGLEDLMMDLVADPPLARVLLERAATLQRHAADRFARAGADVIITGDDVAGQQGLLMSIDTWRAFLKPLLAQTARAVRDASADAFLFYHSDGDITPIIPDLIDVGVQILNPIQPECMDPARIKRDHGDRLAFWGAISVQRTMPSGSPDDVRAEVRARIRDIGRGGGYILAPAHVLPPETPWENIVAFFEAADSTPPES